MGAALALVDDHADVTVLSAQMNNTELLSHLIFVYG
jgi:hypothetical protein